MSGVDPVTGRPYASVGRRLAAYLVDALATLLLWAGSAGLVTVGVANDNQLVVALGLVVGLLALAYALAVLVGIARTGRSPGKKALGLVVLDQATGRPIGFLRALLRQLVLGVLGPVNLVQLLFIGKHQRRQGWHDNVGDSVVLDEKTGQRTAAPVTGPASALPSLATGPLPSPPGSLITPPPVAPLPGGLVPPPPGIVLPPPPPAPSVEPPARTERRQPSPSAASAVPAPAATALRLTAASGVTMHLSGMVLAGRDPDTALVEGAVVWRLQDPELSVSKTHALFGTTDGAAWVEDWHSTNGVALRRGGQETELSPHERVPLQAGDELLLGDFVVRVDRA